MQLHLIPTRAGSSEMVINSLFPVFFLLVLGVLLKRLRITGDVFVNTSDKIVYYFFFPALLFWKIGESKSVTDIDPTYLAAGLCIVLTTVVFSVFCITFFRISAFQAGAFSQSCYRFNTYIGMAVIVNALGMEAIQYFGILISILIPVINICAVSTLIWYNGNPVNTRRRIITAVKAMISNPLIIGCLAGLAYSRGIGEFPTFINNTLSLMTSVTLPLALLSIGASLTLKGISSHLKISLLASMLKLFFIPASGFFLLKYMGVEGLPFKVSMIFFALPTSTSVYVLSSQLNSDTELASASIVISTILSLGSLSVAIII